MFFSYDFIRYQLVPPVFVIAFTTVVQILAQHGQGNVPNWESVKEGLIGDWTSLLFVLSYFSWAYLWLRLSKTTILGPPSPTGFVPKYKDNGLIYYIATFAAHFLIDVIWNFKLSLYIYDQTPKILGTLSSIGLLLCLHLYLSPSDDPKTDENLPAPYIFYRGRNFHPRLLGIDVKQLTNCRIGLMSFQIFELAHFTTSIVKNGELCWANSAVFLLHTFYLAKFFCNESKYFYTIDIMQDRAGYYLCWGCIVWIPCFFTYNSYFMVHYHPVISDRTAVAVTIIGVMAIFIQTLIDRQRYLFRSTEGKLKIWGKEPRFIKACYTDLQGNQKESLLLTSGFWGLARHFNYAFELVYALCICIPGYGAGFTPFLYFGFMLILLVHRVFRDDEKCREKYGSYWEEYCRTVPYKILPFVF